jgi:hypothetical protein
MNQLIAIGHPVKYVEFRQTRRRPMKATFALSAVMLAAIMSQALAAEKYYLVTDGREPGCMIMIAKPSGPTFSVVSTYGSLKKAEKAIKTTKNCGGK